MQDDNNNTVAPEVDENMDANTPANEPEMTETEDEKKKREEAEAGM